MPDATGDHGDRTARRELLGWGGIALVLVALAVPWFLWRDATVAAGLPLWIWWHVGWMALASVVFYVFTRRAWGVGVVPAAARRRGPDGGAEADRPAEAGGSTESGEVTRRG